VVGNVVWVAQKYVHFNLELGGSEIMRKAQAHRPAASRAAGGGVFGL